MLALCYTVSLRMVAGADHLVDALGPCSRGDQDHVPPWSGEDLQSKVESAERRRDGDPDDGWKRELGTRNQELKSLAAWNSWIYGYTQ